MMRNEDLRDFLDTKARQYEHPQFLDEDPLKVPHWFDRKEDIEISGFLTATIAWGNRKSIIQNAGRMMRLMDMAPYQFVMQHGKSDLNSLSSFVHRTFNATDLTFFLTGLKNLYEHHQGLEGFFAKHATQNSMQPAISRLKEVFFELPHPPRTVKHLPDPGKGSAAKRLNMFLRWMVRKSDSGVDFGLWNAVSPAQLSCPLDVHSGNVARRLGLLQRKQNDAKAVSELDAVLRQWDPDDPVKYDFALFGLGVFEKWS
jgi:uncharacterized protein (TIGR02757 family)